MTDLLKDRTQKVLFKMSIPISIGMLSTFLFQVIDTYFVGQLGPEALAALSFSSTLYFVLVSLYIGLSVGISIIVGQAVGTGDRSKTLQTTRWGLALSLLLSSVLSIVFILFLGPLFTILGAPVSILELIQEYLFPMLLGMPLLTVGLTAGAILRASGNILQPEIIMGVAGAINLILDYGLIFGNFGWPELGIAGAAWATFASWVFVFVGMSILLIKDRLISFNIIPEIELKPLFKEIFSLSGPTILTQIIGPLTVTYITFMLANESPLAVAAFGVVSRVELLLLIGVMAVSTSITPFVAQNIGAKQHKRVDEAIVFGGKSATYLGLVVALILWLFVEPIAGLFSADPTVVQYTTTYFNWVSLSYIFYAFYVITSSIYNGLKQTKVSLQLSAIKSFVFVVPLVALGSFWGVQGIFVSIAASNILAGVVASKSMSKYIQKEHPELSRINKWKDYASDFTRFKKSA